MDSLNPHQNPVRHREVHSGSRRSHVSAAGPVSGGDRTATHVACFQTPKCYFIFFPDEVVVEQAWPGAPRFFSFLKKILLDLLGWHWLIKLRRFQVYNSVLHNLFTNPSCLLPSPFIPPLPSPASAHPSHPQVIAILLSVPVLFLSGCGFILLSWVVFLCGCMWVFCFVLFFA